MFPAKDTNEDSSGEENTDDEEAGSDGGVVNQPPSTVRLFNCLFPSFSAKIIVNDPTFTLQFIFSTYHSLVLDLFWHVFALIVTLTVWFLSFRQLSHYTFIYYVFIHNFIHRMSTTYQHFHCIKFHFIPSSLFLLC